MLRAAKRKTPSGVPLEAFANLSDWPYSVGGFPLSQNASKISFAVPCEQQQNIKTQTERNNYFQPPISSAGTRYAFVNKNKVTIYFDTTNRVCEKEDMQEEKSAKAEPKLRPILVNTAFHKRLKKEADKRGMKITPMVERQLKPLFAATK